MKKYITQLILFSISPLVIFVGFILFSLPNNQILNISLETKIKKLEVDTSKINIIIAGDSRAERQLIPEIINQYTYFSTINIATSSCDLITVTTAIENKYSTKSNIIYVISASSWQINDGAIDPGYLSENCFNNLTMTEKFKIYHQNLSEAKRLQLQLIKTSTKKKKLSYNSDIINELGFHGIEKTLNCEFADNYFNETNISHPWYKNLNNDGVRWLLFQKALKKLGKINSTFIIYNPPVSDCWRSYTKNTVIDIAEKQYSQKLEIEIEKYTNIVFYDFYNNKINELNDSLYYDGQHLNKEGAKIFSTIISSKILNVVEMMNRN